MSGIEALITGKLHKPATARTSRNGNRFVTCMVRVPTGQPPADGGQPPLIFVSVICFAEAACEALLALGDGDAVSLAGEITPKVYIPANGGEPRASLDMTATQVLTVYHARRKRLAMSGDGADTPQTRQEGAGDPREAANGRQHGRPATTPQGASRSPSGGTQGELPGVPRQVEGDAFGDTIPF